jgi:hypothetical protein
MQKMFSLVAALFFSASLGAQNCDKGCGKITKVEATTNPKIRADRALLVFNFQGPNGKPAKSHIKIVVDKDTIAPELDKFGSTKITSTAGSHKLRFKANWWYTVKMDKVTLKAKNTYYIQVRFEAEEIGGSKPKDTD